MNNYDDKDAMMILGIEPTTPVKVEANMVTSTYWLAIERINLMWAIIDFINIYNLRITFTRCYFCNLVIASVIDTITDTK